MAVLALGPNFAMEPHPKEKLQFVASMEEIIADLNVN